MARKYYAVQLGGPAGFKGVISATAVSLEFAKGFAKGIQQYMPHPAIRIVVYGTDELIEQFPESTGINTPMRLNSPNAVEQKELDLQTIYGKPSQALLDLVEKLSKERK